MSQILFFKTDYYIYTENSLSQRCYLLNKGKVTLFSKDFGSLSVTAGGLFGFYSYMWGTTRRESAVAGTDCEIIVLEREEVKNLILDNPVIRESTIASLIGFLKMANKKIESKNIHSPDNIPEKIFEGFLYYYGEKDIKRVFELFRRLEKHYKDTSYYKKALSCLNELNHAVDETGRINSFKIVNHAVR